jgi:beta-glucuronidase
LNQLCRRDFLHKAGTATAAAAASLMLPPLSVGSRREDSFSETRKESLDGTWLFKLDPRAEGESQGWYEAALPPDGWHEVTVPHTWQISSDTSEYTGVAWYRRSIMVPSLWAEKAVRLEFEAVYHSAVVWLNGRPIGQHLGKGYTAFTLHASPALRLGALNHLAVKVDNSFDAHMLPRSRSYDWAPDGGIIRSVSLLITPSIFIERVDVDSQPDLENPRASLDIRVALRSTSREAAQFGLAYSVAEEDSGRLVVQEQDAARVELKPEVAEEVRLPATTLPNPRLWHFDHPHLYRLVVSIVQGGQPLHCFSTTFGVRKLEIKDCGFHLNGERVWLMGVERMAGSNPEFGMAEPGAWIRHDHDELKELNCVFTRVHWQQDRRTLDYCDRHGILIQEEVPTWGPATFEGMGAEPAPDILENGLAQLREMISRDRNHPSICTWGLCNEIGGQIPAAYQFAQAMFAEAKKLDATRPLTYASHSLGETPERDVSGLMDFISRNEYYGSWSPGGPEDVRRNLEDIHRAFPSKPIVISEYGYCECTPVRVGGDPRRIETLRSHDQVFRELDYVAGAIFFCYNDYRTHIGDKGMGALKQRVHGVVDLYGRHKPSFDSLREESSPVEQLLVKAEGKSLAATVVSRRALPRYRLDGYTVRWIIHGFDGLPMEKHEVPLPLLEPGQTATVQVTVQEERPRQIQVDVMRPTGFSALTTIWRPQ